MLDHGMYALLYANGMPLHEVFKLQAHDLAEYIRDNHHSNGGKPCVGNRCHVRQVSKLILSED
jgi:hypothetical protein